MSVVFDVARAGNMVIFNPQGTDWPDDPMAILTAQEHSQHMPVGVGKSPDLCVSAEHLAELLAVGFTSWKEFRGVAVDGSKESA